MGQRHVFGVDSLGRERWGGLFSVEIVVFVSVLFPLYTTRESLGRHFRQQ